MYDAWEDRPQSVKVADLRRRAEQWVKAARAKGEIVAPVALSGKKIAKRFWGKAWCDHLEALQDYAGRLPRGRSYVLNGAVVDLQIAPGVIRGKVLGENLYDVCIRIDFPDSERIEALKRRCACKVACLLDILEGKMSEEFIAVLCDPEGGLMPASEEFHLDCNCPDWADLCKHLSAVLYAVGAQLDLDPGLLFTLRGIQAEEFCQVASLPAEASSIDTEHLGNLFGIDLD